MPSSRRWRMHSRPRKPAPPVTSVFTLELGGNPPSIWPELRLGLDAFLALLLADPAVVEVAPVDGALRRFVPLRQPVAERVAEPRRLGPELRQPQLLPDLFRALHVFLLRQRERRHVALHGRIHQQSRVLLLPVLALGAVALAAVPQGLHVLDRVH